MPKITETFYILLYIEAKGKIKLLDINEAPSRSEEECVEEEDEDSPVPRKKLRLTKDQSRRLEQSFVQNQTLNPVRLLINLIIYEINHVFFKELGFETAEREGRFSNGIEIKAKASGGVVSEP